MSMQKQITKKQTWLRVETTQGTEFVDAGGLSLFVRNSESLDHSGSEQEKWNTKKAIAQYCEGEPESWENVQGYGARLSAPGYTDCTEWTVFDTEQEAEAYLEEMYGDEEEETDGN